MKLNLCIIKFTLLKYLIHWFFKYNHKDVHLSPLENPSKFLPLQKNYTQYSYSLFPPFTGLHPASHLQSLWICLSILNISNKCVAFCAWLLLPSMFSMLIHVITFTSSLFFNDKIIFHCINTPHFFLFIHSLALLLKNERP